MSKFLNKNKYKIALVLVVAVVVLSLTSCRFDSGSWYTKPYTTYGQEWSDLWNGGRGFFNTLFAWPINLISYPIAWLCSQIGKAIGNSFFWGIFFTTLIVRTLAWPIYSRQNGMSLKMNLMQPEMNKIQRKYQGRQDPRSQQMMQQEMMQLYKKYKINPLGCFGTMILQFPIFMAMYEVVQRINATSTVTADGISITSTGIFALHNTKFLGFEIASSFMGATQIGDKMFGLVVALLFGAVTFLSQKLGQRPMKYQKNYNNNVKTKDQAKQGNQMKIMMIVMNVVFVFMALQSTALGIYWLIGGIYQLFQSQVGRWINQRNYEKAQKNNIL